MSSEQSPPTPPTPPTPVPAASLSLYKMTTGNEDLYPVVIDGGIVKEWVGIGWIESHKATDEDRLKYPEVFYYQGAT